MIERLRPKKDPNIIEKVRKSLKDGNYRDPRHSIERGKERNIDFLDIKDVLENGYHEKSKDLFREDYQSWNYAIRGKTFEGDELRIAIYFEGEIMMIATVIRL